MIRVTETKRMMATNKPGVVQMKGGAYVILIIILLYFLILSPIVIRGKYEIQIKNKYNSLNILVALEITCNAFLFNPFHRTQYISGKCLIVSIERSKYT